MENTETKILKINVALRGEIADAFEKYQTDEGLLSNAPIVHGFVVQKLREKGYLPQVSEPAAVAELQEAA